MTKSKKCVLYVLIVTLVFSFGLLSFTAAKYIREVGNSGSAIGPGDIPLNMLDKIEVTTQEDMYNALKNGYPYIKLSNNVKDPLIVTQDILQVNKSVVFDLNGKRLERVGSDAMIDVKEGITLTIIDSNPQATGGLYNPVGTVLRVSGGALNVRGGKFESGPRTWEYASYTANNRLTENNFQPVRYYAKGDEQGTEEVMPIIKPNIIKEGGVIKSVDGNIYFDVAYKCNENRTIPADTYCYYVTSDNFSSNTTTGFDDSGADFRYSYYVQPTSYEYVGNPANTEGLVEITVYGFEKDIQKAMGWVNGETGITVASGVNEAAAPWYAAVYMEDGTLNVDCQDPSKVVNGKSIYVDTDNYKTIGMGKNAEGETLTGEAYTKNVEAYKSFGKGSFISYFGVETTSCIQFTGGNMTVSTDGVFATVNPQTINKIYEAKGEANTALSSEGRSVVIHNNGRSQNDDYGTLTINGGNFLTYNMSVVRLMKGHCIINDSKFYRVQDTRLYKYKTTIKTDTGENKDVTGHLYGTGTVYSAGGNVDIYDTQVWISSVKELEESALAEITDFEGAYGIYSVDGVIKATNTIIYADGDCCRGIYSNPQQSSDESGAQPALEGEGGLVDLYNIKVFVSGDRTFGIYSRGGIIKVNADAPNLKEGAPEGTINKDDFVFNSRFFVSGNKTMGIYAVNKEVNARETKAIQMENTRIRVNVSDQGDNYPNRPGDFNVAINSVRADLEFTNISVESLAYGVTALYGAVDLIDCKIDTNEAAALIVKGGTVTAKGATDIDCYIKQVYVDGGGTEDIDGDGVVDDKAVPNLWEKFLLPEGDTRNYFKTHSAVDIQGGLLDVVHDGNSTDDHFDLLFNTDIVTPKTKDRIGIKAEDGTINNIPYVVNGKNADGTEKKSPVFNEEGQMYAASAMLPSAMCAVRVSGTKGNLALNIITNCTITANVGGGILVRDGDVQLGDEKDQKITVRALGTDYYGDKTYHFMDKNYWDYRDTKTGGNALFVSGGDVTSHATLLTLESALGNGLFVTSATILPDENFIYKGEIKLDEPPTVTIDAGKFNGDATTDFLKGDGNHGSEHGCNGGFYFTGPSSFYGVKVVCGGNVTINGGTFSGYGAVCTMGAITQEAVRANLTINGDCRNESDRITMSGKKDVACFYNASNVIINSYDNPSAKIKATGKYDYEKAEDFGVAIPNGGDTAIVIEYYEYVSKRASTDPATPAEDLSATTVTINGGYYRALKGDPGAKAIWCSNNKATLAINGGYFIGNQGGGAIQLFNDTRLKTLNLNGGYFLNYGNGNGADYGSILAGTIPSGMLHVGKNDEKTFYQLTTKEENGINYFMKTDNDAEGNWWNSAVYVADKKTTEEQQPEQPQQ